MAEDIATIGLAVDSRQVRKADRDLKKFNKTGKTTERTSDQMSAGFKRMVGALAGIVSVTAAASKLVNVSRSFDVMNASLVTVTGSTEDAAKAFDALQAFAKETPFSLDEVSQAFVKLGVLGLEPSRAALISYGNTASAMGKSLDQLVEAVADATTGEFERLKEFGIKASQQGDRVAFTFRGITTTVGKNSQEIQDYLRQIGDNDFAGAMQRRAESLDGALSNLEVAWDQLFLTISQQGTGDLIYASVQRATEVIEELDAFIASGSLGHHIDAIGTQFFETGKDIESAVNAISKLLTEASNSWSADGQNAVLDIQEAFLNLPANVRAALQITTIEIVSGFQKVVAQLKAEVKAGPLGLFSDDGDLAALQATFLSIENARAQSIASIVKEREVIVERAEAERKAAVVSFKAEKARRAARTGELPTLPGSGGEKGPTQAEIKAREKRADAIKKSEDALKKWLTRAELELSLSNESAEQREKAIKLWELEQQGVDLTSEAYAGLADRLEAVYDQREVQRKFLEDQEKTAEKQQKIWEDTVGQIQQHFSDNFFDIMQGNFDSLADGFKAMLDRMIADALSAQLSQALFGSQASPTGLGSILTGGGGGIFGDIFGGGGGSSSPFSQVLSFDQAISGAFANGTNFAPGGFALVGERGPEVVNLPRGSKVTPNEKLGNSTTNVFNFTVSGQTDRRSQQQIADAAYRGVTRANARNG